MNRDSLRFAGRLSQHDSFLGEHKSGCLAEEVSRDHRTACGDRMSTLDDGYRVVSGVRHERRSGDAALETLRDRLARQIAADEDDAAVALLAVFPRALVIAVEDHVHALKHKALIVILE
jgi:hypothetical protein